MGTKEITYCGKKGIHIFSLSLSETGLNRIELFKKFNTFVKFCELFKITPEELEEFCAELCIIDRSLFEYTEYNHSNTVLIEKRALCTKKMVLCCQRLEYKYTYYDLCLCESKFADLALSKVAELILQKRFNAFFGAMFSTTTKRFKESIENLPANIKTLIDDIDSNIIFDNNLTIEDLINLYTIPGYAQSNVNKSIAKIYANGHIFINLGEEESTGRTLFLTITDLYNKDWEAVEKRHVFSVLLSYGEKTNKRTWFEGNQKDAPYFNNPTVKLIKEVFFS